MANQLELIQEAARRGILPESKKPFYEEAVRRGLIGGPKQEIPQDTSIGRTALDQGLQGATFALGDEITDAMGAVYAKGSDLFRKDKLFEGRGIGDIYDEARDSSKKRLQAQFEERPALAIASNIAGGLLTGGAAATTKAGTAAGNMLRSGGTAARIAKGAGAGALSGAAYGAGAADDGNRLEGAKQGAIYGGVVGGAVPAVGAAVGAGARGTKSAIKGATARSADQLDDAVGAIKETSSKAYQAMRDAGAVINKPRAVNIANKVAAAVKKDGTLNPRLHSTTIGLLDDFKAAAQKGDFTLEELDQWRQVFGQVAGNFNDTYNKRAASIAINAIDDAVDNLGKIDLRGGNTAAIRALNAGRSEWRKARKFEQIADIIKKSEGDANYLKRELKKIITNPKKARGFTEQELSAIKQASDMTVGDSILKTLGRFGFDNARLGTGVGAIVGSAGAGAAAGVPGAIAAPIVGTAARQGRKLITRGNAENILNTIEGKAMQNSARKAISPMLSAPAGAAGGTIAGGAAAAPAPVIQPMQPVLPKPRAENNLMQRMEMAESSGNPNARNPNSSASGVMQFTDPTWMRVVNKWGKKHGITMKDKDNPEAQRTMAYELAMDNKKIIENGIGRTPTNGELYMAHVFGAAGAKKLIKNKNSRLRGVDIFPAKVVRANRPLFYQDGKPLSVGEVYALLESKIA